MTKIVDRFFERVRRFLRISWKRKILLTVIFFLTGLIRAAQLVLPFRFLAAIMGKEMSDSPLSLNVEKQMRARIIGRYVIKISKYTPWKSECLVQALTAQIILRFFKISNTVYLGIAKDESNKLIAHAWIRSGSIILTGGSERERFKTIIKFACNHESEVNDYGKC